MTLVVASLLLLAFAAIATFARGEQRLSALFSAMDEVVFVIDRDGRYVDIAPNPLLVLPVSQYRGKKIHDVIPVATADVVLANARRVIASGEKHTVDYALTLDGRTTWWSAAVTPLGHDRALWVARDITTRKRVEDALQESNVELEEELRRSEKLYRGIVEQARDVIFTLDVEGRFTSLNPVFESITGWPVHEWIGRNFRDLLDPRGREHGEQAFLGAFDGDSVLLSRGRVRGRDERQVTFEVSLVTQRENGSVTGFLGLARDVTAREREQEQLAQAHHLSSLGRIAAQIAHEFNNVLMGMQANVELLQRRAPAQLAKPVEHVLRAVQRGKRVTDEILSFTRRTPPSLQQVPLETFFSSWEQEIRPMLGPSVDLSIEVEPGLHMLVDPLQIAQVLTNLALNARDAMQGRGFLEVQAERSRGTFGFVTPKAASEYVHIRVTDSGVGMSAQELEHLFEPLFTTKHTGVGLGLPVAHQIITKHDGFITAESESGNGATFHLLLRRTEPAEIAEEPGQKAMQHAARILIVEDELAVAAGLQALLELDGIDSTIVVTGGEAVGAIERESPDAVILDIGLPDMNGVDVYKRIAARWAHLPVLFSSGHANAAELDAELRKPHIGLLLKPYDYDALRAALAKLAIGGVVDVAQSSAAALPVM